jgi:hypothetical protein
MVWSRSTEWTGYHHQGLAVEAVTAIQELMEEFGTSYRQLDYWIRKGYIHTVPNERSGSGYSRQLSEDEIQIARYMIRLTNAGFMVGAAALIARRFVLEDTRETLLPDGVVVKIRKRYASSKDL